VASGEEAGTHRFIGIDALGNPRAVVIDELTSKAVSQATLTPVGVNRTAMHFLRPSSIKLNEGSKLRWEWKAVSADIVESEESSIELPVVLINKQTGQMIPKTLTAEDFVGFQPSATTDITNSTTDFVKLGDYTVPTGFMAKFPGGSFHAYVGDDA